MYRVVFTLVIKCERLIDKSHTSKLSSIINTNLNNNINIKGQPVKVPKP